MAKLIETGLPGKDPNYTAQPACLHTPAYALEKVPYVRRLLKVMDLCIAIQDQTNIVDISEVSRIIRTAPEILLMTLNYL